MLRSFLESVGNEWQALLSGNFRVQDIAAGMALGTFAALLPTYGFGPFLALIIASFFTSVNKPAIFIALAVWNPVLQIPVYAGSLALGDWLYGGEPVMRYNLEMLNQVFTFTRRFLVGHVIMTVAITLIMYVVGIFFGKYLLRRPRRQRPS